MTQRLEFAKDEMRRAGLYDADADYGPGAIAECVEGMVEAFGKYGHSGGSAGMTLAVFDKVARFRPLTPLTSDPAEWMEVGPDVWQNRRQHTAFSTDGGATWYDIDEPFRPIHTSEVPRPTTGEA